MGCRAVTADGVAPGRRWLRRPWPPPSAHPSARILSKLLFWNFPDGTSKNKQTNNRRTSKKKNAHTHITWESIEINTQEYQVYCLACTLLLQSSIISLIMLQRVQPTTDQVLRRQSQQQGLSGLATSFDCITDTGSSEGKTDEACEIGDRDAEDGRVAV